MKFFEVNRNWDDGIGTGRIDLSGMTWYEYTEWALAQEDNTQPSKMDRHEKK